MGFMCFFSQKRCSRYVRQSNVCTSVVFRKGIWTEFEFELEYANLNLNHKSLGLGTKLMGLKRSVIQIRSRVKLVTPRPLEERRLSTNAFLEGRAHEELLTLNEVWSVRLLLECVMIYMISLFIVRWRVWSRLSFGRIIVDNVHDVSFPEQGWIEDIPNVAVSPMLA